MIARWTRWVTSHPGWVLAALLGITAALGVFALRVDFLADMEQMLPMDDPIVDRFETTKDRFGSASMILLAIEAPEDMSLFNLASVGKLYALTTDLETLEDEGLLSDVISPSNVDTIQGTDLELIVGPASETAPETQTELDAFRSKLLAERQVVDVLVLPDGSAFSVVLKVDPKWGGDDEKIGEIMRRVDSIVSEYKGPEAFYVTGDGAYIHYANEYMHKDLRTLLPIVIAVVLLVLFASFRSVRGAVLPVLVVLFALVWTLGLMSLFGAQLTLASSFMPVLLVAVGSAYGIHIVNEYSARARGARQEDRKKVIVDTMNAMMNPVVISALTTAVGFLTLLSAFLPPIRDFGVFSAIGVLFALCISVSFIPACLALLPLPKGKAERSHQRAERFGAALARGIMGRKRWIAVVIGLTFIAFAALIPHIGVESDVSKYFDDQAPVSVGKDYLDTHFGGSLQTGIVIETGARDGIKEPDVLQFIDELQAYVESLDPVGSTTSIVDVVKETNETLHGDDATFYAIPDTKRGIAQTLFLYEMGGGEVLESMVTRTYTQAQVTARVRAAGTAPLREMLGQIDTYLAEHVPEGVTAYTTGMPSIYIRISDKLISSQIVSLLASFAAVWLLVAVLMRSPVAGAFALVPLVVSVVGNFGTIVLAGQDLDMVTVMIASLVVGIGVDYAVHFINRYRQERRAGKEDVEALSATYASSGRAIMTNAMTLVLGFLVLCLSELGALVTMGWLVALTMVTSGLGALIILPTLFGLMHPRFLSKPTTASGTSKATGNEFKE